MGTTNSKDLQELKIRNIDKIPEGKGRHSIQVGQVMDRIDIMDSEF